MQKKFILLLSVIILFLLGCKKAPDTPNTMVPERLELTPATASVISGNTTTYTLKYFNTLGEEKPVPAGVSWSSLDNSIATVNQQGVVTGIAAGQTTIKVVFNGVSATALITVTASTVPERLEISSTSNTVTAGTTNTLTLKYFNNQGVQATVPPGVVWATSNAALATVNQQGVVTAIAAGTPIIMATLNSIMANFTITVTNSLERLEVSPGSANIVVGNTATFTLTYFNTTGIQAPVPAGVIWSSNNNAIATVNSTGVVTGVAAGQTTIRATLNAAIFTTASVTVTANATLATITLSPANEIEVALNQSATVTAVGKDGNGNVIPGLVFNWATANSALVTVNNGQVTGVAYGTANVTASASSITSPPLMVQVVRGGTFNGGHGSIGSAKLKIVNGVLRLETSADFSVSTGAPDLRIYLTNATNNTTGAVEVATLNLRSGAQSWAVPLLNPAGQPVTITSYSHIMVWCRQFGGNYGHVVLP
jgi:uncharacterized protein YjdB